MRFIKTYPDDIDFLSFFESEPSYTDLSGQCVAYTVSNGEVSLEFSFNVTEGWIQTRLHFNDNVISQYLTEGVDSIEIKNDKRGEYIFVEVDFNGVNTVVEIFWKPLISVSVNSLLQL